MPSVIGKVLLFIGIEIICVAIASLTINHFFGLTAQLVSVPLFILIIGPLGGWWLDRRLNA